MLKTRIIPLKNHVEQISKKNNEPEWLLKKRLQAFKIFSEALIPTFVYGLNINMDIGLDLDKINIENSGKAKIDIKNKNKDVLIENFLGVLKNHENIFKENFMAKCVIANDKFTSFHQAFLNNMAFIYVPKNVKANEPIELKCDINSEVFFEHLIILAEKNSELSLVESLTSASNNLYRSKIVEIFADENSTINYGNVQLLADKTTNFEVKRAIIGKNAKINWMDCCFGSKATISEITTVLNGENALTNNYGIFFGSKSQQFDLAANSIHNAPHTTSNMHAKGALTGNAKCIYRGLIKIHKNAFGSNGYQKEDALLLSNDAAADSMPNLEIDNNDVKCTHGATIGRIDREKLFYMQSRGLNEKQAAKEYVKGFFEPLIQKIKIEKLRDSMHNILEERI